jgi:hypothetical protein
MTHHSRSILIPIAMLVAAVPTRLPGQTPGSGPGPISQHRMGFDPASRKILLYSGIETSTQGNRYRSRLWAGDGTSWTLLATDGPPGRDDEQLVFDTRRGRLVLYGGRRVGATRRDMTLLTDTWEWDGTAWHLIDSVGAPPRVHGGMAYDAGRGVTVLFGGGGDGDSVRADTWEWSGAGWQRRADGPPNRWVNGLVYDPKHGGILLHSAPRDSYDQQKDYARSDLWRWDGSVWARRDSAPPLIPQSPVVATDDGVLFFDGWNKDHEVKVWSWDGASWRREAGTPPPRRGTAMLYDPVRRRVLLLGGETDHDLLGDLWEFDGKSWVRKP